MKRFVLLAAITAAAAGPAAILGGCSEDGGGSKMNSPFKKAPAAAAPSSPNYFEIKKNKKTYVLASPASIQALNKDEASLKLKEMPAFGPKEATVVFENSNYTDYNRLVAEYKKNHNLP